MISELHDLDPSVPFCELTCCEEEYARIKKDGGPPLEECSLLKYSANGQTTTDSSAPKAWYQKGNDENVTLWIKKIGCVGFDMSTVPSLIVQMIKLYNYNSKYSNQKIARRQNYKPNLSQGED